MDWPEDGLWYGTAYLDNIVSENVLDIQQSDFLLHECHIKLKVGFGCKNSNFGRGKKNKEVSPRETHPRFPYSLW